MVWAQALRPKAPIHKFTRLFQLNHFPTIYQLFALGFSLKTVGKLVAKELHFGNPFQELLCYPVLIFVSLRLGVLGSKFYEINSASPRFSFVFRPVW
jgi:hypothetical protein